MKIKKADDKPLVIHTKNSPEIHKYAGRAFNFHGFGYTQIL